MPINLTYNKYHNEKVDEDGYTFDSKAERDRYGQLKLMASAGEIWQLQVHPVFTLLDAFAYRGKRVRATKYEADFSYISAEGLVVEDLKGKETEAFRIKRKLFMLRYPGIIFKTVRAEDVR